MIDGMLAGIGEQMPVYFEAEQVDGTTYRWVLSSDDLEKVIGVLGDPETVR